MKCDCESNYCQHSLRGRSCENEAGDTSMRFVGQICDQCAVTVRAHGGGVYLTAPRGTS